MLFLPWITESRLLEFSWTFRKLLKLLIIIFCSISSITTVLESILAFNWVSSYLTTGSSLFSLLQHVPKPEPIVCGIPQGSLLRPFLSIIYINDLPNASNLLKTFLFSNDTSFFYSHKDPNQLIRVMNCELSKIFEWLKLNKLSLNVAKTNYNSFST